MFELMARSIVKQPNGMYAIWSDTVDNFTYINATATEVVEAMVEDYGATKSRAVNYFLARANEDVPNPIVELPAQSEHVRWNQCLDTILFRHGRAERDTVQALNDEYTKQPGV